MTEGKLLPKLFAFAVPVLLSGVLQLAFNAADLIVVGRFCGEAALAAVGSNMALVSPTLRRMAEQKLYSAWTGRPQK